VNEVTRPSSHKITKITASVQSKSMSSSLSEEVGSRESAGHSATFCERKETNVAP
jgi:hypothetical protein